MKLKLEPKPKKELQAGDIISAKFEGEHNYYLIVLDTREGCFTLVNLLTHVIVNSVRCRHISNISSTLELSVQGLKIEDIISVEEYMLIRNQ